MYPNKHYRYPPLIDRSLKSFNVKMNFTNEQSCIMFQPYLRTIELNLLDKENKVEYTNAFNEIFNGFRSILRKNDPLIANFGQVLCIGSFFNKIKIGLPDEFDMNLCIKLPINYSGIVIEEGLPGFIKLKIPQEIDDLKRLTHWNNFKFMENWLDDDKYLLTTSFRIWMESAVSKSLNQLRDSSGNPVLTVGKNSYKIAVKKSGPAFTLLAQKLGSDIKISIDLVPVLIFNESWPSCMVNSKNFHKLRSKQWFAVAKSLKIKEKEVNRMWRLSFPQQEEELLDGNNNMKTILKYIKQIKESHKMPYIASYYINTLFLWANDKENDDSLFWNKNTSFLLMYMLKEFFTRISKKYIPYYWNDQHNLVANVTDSQLKDCVIKLARIFKEVEMNYEKCPAIINWVLFNDRLRHTKKKHKRQLKFW